MMYSAQYRFEKIIKHFGYRVIKERWDDELLYHNYDDSDLLINIGGGDFYHPHWLNLEYISKWYPEHAKKNLVNHDLTSQNKLPFKNNTVSIIYSSHVIEHVPEEDTEWLLQEAFRVMKPGAIIRITCPDAEVLLQQTILGNRAFYYDQVNYYSRFENYKHHYVKPMSEFSIEQLFIDVVASARCKWRKNTDSPLEDDEIRHIIDNNTSERALNLLTSECKYNKNNTSLHVTWWSVAKLKQLLATTGFQQIEKMGAGQSNAGPLLNRNLFDVRHLHKSLFVEAVKS
jgi:predicted SAM-dependent methyltransferase